MRLTLRTLLAWIDALLGPDEQRSLGEKVAASEVAPRLAVRIGAVVANPAIAAPPPDGRGLADDPNVAAEFLDNVLEPARLEAFERVCIESDVHLADVASCHGILAETIRDPACIEPPEPARLRAALEAARKSLHESTSASEQVEIDTSAPQRGDRRDAPPPRRRTPLAAWLSAAVAFLVLLGLAGFLVWTFLRPPRTEPRQVAAPPAAIPTKDVQDRRPEEQPLAGPDPRPPVPDDATAAAPAAGVDPAPEPPRVDLRPPDELEVATVDHPDGGQPRRPPPAAAPASPPERSVPFGDALAIGGGAAESSPGPADQAAADSPSAPRTQEPSAEGVPAIVEGAVLFRSVVEPGGWLAATAAAPLADVSGPLVLLAPAWTYPVVGIHTSLVRLHPGTMVTLSTDGHGMPRLELTTGRVVAVSAGADLRFAVAAGGLEGVVAGPPGMPVGVEVSATRRAQAAAVPRATIHAGGAAIAWRQAAADGQGRPLMGVPLELLIPQATALCWDGRDPAAAALVTEAEPGWMRAVAPVDRTLRRAAADIVAALSAAAEAPPADILRRELTSGRPENRMAAAATLALLGDHAGLADLLCEEPPRGLHEGQWLALEEATVPVILARGGKESESLLDALRERTPAPDAAEVVALARDDDAAEPAVAQGLRLVDDLDSASIVVRRFAILRLRESVPSARRLTDDYRADRSASLRAESVASWRETVSRGVGEGENSQAAPAPRRRDDE